MQKKKSLFNRRGFWITTVILGVLVIGGYYAYPLLAAPEVEATNESEIQTAVARQGDLVIFASGTGNIVAPAEISIGFEESGVLADLSIRVGDLVETDQAIALLKTYNSEEEIALAISNSEISVLNAQNALDEIHETWETDVAIALQAIANAQQTLEDAEVAFRRTGLTASQSTIDTEYADMIMSQAALEKAEENFEPVAGRPEEDLERARLQSELSTAQQAYDNAVANYNAAISTSDETEQAVAEADLALANAQLADAQRAYERIKDGPDADEITLVEAQLENAQLQLVLDQQKQAYLELLAPLDGTVLDISADVGEALSTNAFVTLADLSQPLLEVYLDETDLDKVAVGFEVEVIFDAFPNDVFLGHITEVDPSLYESSNVTAVKALVALDSASFAKPQTLPIGLNASVDVVGGRAEDVVLVPVEALRELSPGEFAVFVMENDEPKLRIVEVGLVDFTSAEIISGLEAGEIVTTGIVDTE
ncbi:MAG: efflux RND transporter periplasmic adaptor subunit [Anaerolineales bacterium]|nr:efflux RND transporter periplasmic adaptor subunit [Chloroflexota bacterium]MBL6982615.1 efflux RND transporter periplasmic adaptor subunit [Anaerolineales bacterium]